MSELKERALAALQELSQESIDFGQLMRKLIPRMFVVPHRLCDGGKVVHRLRLTLNLVPFLESNNVPDEAAKLLIHELSIDLFDPPQRVRFRKQIIEMRRKMTEAQVAKELGITVTAAQHAAQLHRLMEEKGLIDPYIELTDPPEDDCKLKRHLHPAYRFSKLSDDQAA